MEPLTTPTTATQPHTHTHTHTHTHRRHTNSLNPNCAHTRRNAFSNYQMRTHTHTHTATKHSMSITLQHGLCFSGRCLSMKQSPLISVIYLLIWQIYSFSNEHEEGKSFFFFFWSAWRAAGGPCSYLKKKKKLVTVMLYMCTYTCGI